MSPHIESWHPSQNENWNEKSTHRKESLSRGSGETLMPAPKDHPRRTNFPEGNRLKYNPLFVESLLIVLVITEWLVSSLLLCIFAGLLAKGI